MHYHSHWKRNQDAFNWVNLSRTQDQGLPFWQAQSHAIIVHDPVPAECICKVISQNGDRLLFERLSTPRPAPKVTLKSNWQSQQQLQQPHQSVCDDVSISTRKLVTDQTGIRDVRGYTTNDHTSTRKLVRNPEPVVEKKPQFEVDLRVDGVSQDAILQDIAKMQEMNEKLEKFKWDHVQNSFVTICRKVE